MFLGGGFKCFLFSPLLGEDSHFDKYFSNGLKPPTRFPMVVQEAEKEVVVPEVALLLQVPQ